MTDYGLAAATATVQYLRKKVDLYSKVLSSVVVKTFSLEKFARIIVTVPCPSMKVPI